MRKPNPSLTEAEWHLMEALWDRPEQTGRELTQQLEHTQGWSRSTTLTVLRRMTQKGSVSCEEKEGLRFYSPRIPRQEALLEQTHSFLDRAYHGSVSLLVSALTEKQELSDEEIKELYGILKKAEEGANHA